MKETELGMIEESLALIDQKFAKMDDACMERATRTVLHLKARKLEIEQGIRAGGWRWKLKKARPALKVERVQNPAAA